MILIVGIVAASTAAAAPIADGIYAGSVSTRPTKNTVEATYGSSRIWMRLRRRMPAAQSHELSSSANDNRLYQYSVSYRMHHCPQDAVLLLNGSATTSPGSAGGDRGSRQCSFYFAVDRAMADSIAQTFGVTRKDRSPVGERVEGSFSTARSAYQRGEPIDVRITLTNPADAPPVEIEGGCVRFSCVVFRDDKRWLDLSAPNGCPVGFRRFEPGASVQDSVDVRRWANIDAPGRYRFECGYHTLFAPPGAGNYFEPNFRARVWDRTFSGVLEVEVQ
jgi:hypothetical protein